MKNMIKSLAVLTAVIGLAVSACAGECCIKAAKDAKACEKCAAKEKK